jgi:hypothetical protein
MLVKNGSHIKMKHPDRMDFIVLNHGSKEIGKGLEGRIRKRDYRRPQSCELGSNFLKIRR